MELKNYMRPYIVAEIGANHNGNMDLAKKMIQAAKDCGADCVKFQSWTKESLFSRVRYEEEVASRKGTAQENDLSLEEMVETYQITPEDHRELVQYCKELGITFNSTPFSKNELDMLVDEFQVPFIKIASMDLNNLPFLKLVGKKKHPVVLSTGLGTLADVSEAVDCLYENGCPEVILLHCTALYPPKDDQVNLNNMDMLRNTFECNVGYSDHTIGTVAPIMAMAKGACLIEKHFTLDKNMEGWDHRVSADVDELKVICQAAKRSYVMLGNYAKKDVEKQQQRIAFQRSIVAAHDMPKGHVLKEEDLDYKRPGSGIPPKYYEFLIGKELKRDIKYDELFRMSDF